MTRSIGRTICLLVLAALVGHPFAFWVESDQSRRHGESLIPPSRAAWTDGSAMTPEPASPNRESSDHPDHWHHCALCQQLGHPATPATHACFIFSPSAENPALVFEPSRPRRLLHGSVSARGPPA